MEAIKGTTGGEGLCQELPATLSWNELVSVTTDRSPILTAIKSRRATATRSHMTWPTGKPSLRNPINSDSHVTDFLLIRYDRLS
jgi:hypothetical protein